MSFVCIPSACVVSPCALLSTGRNKTFLEQVTQITVTYVIICDAAAGQNTPYQQWGYIQMSSVADVTDIVSWLNTAESAVLLCMHVKLNSSNLVISGFIVRFYEGANPDLVIWVGLKTDVTLSVEFLLPPSCWWLPLLKLFTAVNFRKAFGMYNLWQLVKHRQANRYFELRLWTFHMPKNVSY
jgi:hypothetical protein